MKALSLRHRNLAATLLFASVISAASAGLAGCSDICYEYPDLCEVLHIPFSPDAKIHAINKHFAAVNRPLPEGSANPASPSLAPYFGNFPISSAPADDVALLRQSNCSLTYFDFGVSATNTTIDLSINTQTPNYEKILHSLALLNTTPDVFPSGCVDNSLGIAARPYIDLGPAKNGQILAAEAPGTDAVYVSGLFPNFTTSPVASLPTPVLAMAVATADLNNDGNPDIVSINSDGTQASLTVFLGNPDGSFQAGTTYALPGTIAQYFVIDDLNGDGKLDLLASSSGADFEFSVLLGNGDGTFQAAQSFSPPTTNLNFQASFITADVNGDGHKDIITSLGQVFLGSANGLTFTLQPQLAFSPSVDSLDPASVVAADFNKDGKTDLATDDGLAIRIFLGNGDGTFTAGPGYAAIPNRGYLTAADLDGDGNIDLLSGLSGNGAYASDDVLPNEMYALMGNGDGTFQGAPYVPPAYTGTNLADLNRDGHLDLVGPATILVSGSRQVVFDTALGQADGAFRPGPQLVLPPYVGGPGGNSSYPVGVESFVVGDFTGDGIPDLLFNPGASIPVAGYYLAVGNGDGSFQTPTFIPAPSFETTGDTDVNEMLAGFVVADFNHDGKLDIAYNFDDTSLNTQNVTVGLAVQLGNGDGTFQAPKFSTTYSSTTPPQEAFTGMIGGVSDVNKDNFPDVFVIIPNVANAMVGHSVVVFIGNGDGSFKAPVPVTLTGDILPQSQNQGFPIAFADLNGDGNVDLVVGGSSADDSTPELAIALGNGDGTFQAPSFLNLEGFGFVGPPAVADFTGDGKLDVYADGIFPGNGDGTLQTINVGGSTVTAPLDIALSVQGAAIGTDLNSDGKDDLIVGNVILLSETGSVVTPPSPATTTTALVSSLNPSTSGQSVTFTANVTSQTAGTPTGTATFFDGATSLGAAVTLNGSSVATFTTSSLSDGSHTITAQYSGDSNFSASTSNAVTQAVNAGSKASSSTALTSSLNPSSSGQSVTFTATVTSQTAGTPTGTATFFDGATALGAAVTLNGSSVATFTTSTLSIGSHTITAQYGGDANFAASTSSALNQQVNAAGQDFSVTASPTTLNLVAGQSGMVVFTVTPLNGSTETLTFTAGTLPRDVTAMFDHPTITLDGTHTATSTLTLQTSGHGLANPNGSGRGAPVPPPVGLTGLLSVLLAIASFLAFHVVVLSRVSGPISARLLARAPHRLPTLLATMLALALVAFALIACDSSSRTTPAGSYSITITIAASGGNHTVPITLNVGR